jgi:hypothetical protein
MGMAVIRQFRQILFWPLEIRSADGALDRSSQDRLETLLETDGVWQRERDSLNRGLSPRQQDAYAEFVYFHPFVRRFLYGEGQDEAPIRLYRREDVRGAKVRLALQDSSEPQPRERIFDVGLDVHRIHLYLFDRGAALLTVEVQARQVTEQDGGKPVPRKLTLDLVEEFLDCFRRVYPPYWETKDDKAGHCPLAVEWIAHAPIAKSNYRNPKVFWRFAIENKVPYLARHWRHLMKPLHPFLSAPLVKGRFYYRQIEDERIPFMAYLSLDDPAQLTRGDFVRLCFADDSGDPKRLPYAYGFLQDFEAKCCYDRYWDPKMRYVDCGPSPPPNWLTTRYLCSGYGFIMVGKEDPGFYSDGRNGALAHFRRHYFQMGLIAHFHRAALLLFSDALSEAVANRAGKRKRDFYDDVNRILKDFLDFTHRYWFREISNQLQARELFSLWTRNLETHALFEQVRQEAQDAKNFLDMEEQNRQTETTVTLTVVATVGLAAGLIGTWLAIPDLKNFQFSPNIFNRHLSIIDKVVLGTLGGLALTILFSDHLSRCIRCLSRCISQLRLFPRTVKPPVRNSMTKYTHYLQVEGVNIYPSLYDTSQLSTVRGGSLLLKLAVELLGGRPGPRGGQPKNRSALATVERFNRKIEELNRGDKEPRIPIFEPPDRNVTDSLAPITTGASSGMYGITGDDPEPLMKEIREYLSNHPYFRHFTFTVVSETASGNFQETKERLLARTRMAQLRQPSLAPTAPGSPEDAAPCRLQGILPAHEAMALPPKDLKERVKESGQAPKVAASCQNRFYFGRYAKFALYETEISALKPAPRWRNLLANFERFHPAESLNEIGDTKDCESLKNKIAVIYFDGNGFGGLQQRRVTSEAYQIEFDQTVKTYRREFLEALAKRWLDYKHTIEDTETGSREIIPLETLLWGGDEMLFVVPASKGFELVQFFYEQSRDWTYQSEPLTHAGGVVFCHYKTPIGRAQKLVRELAESVKEKEYGRKGNFFDYVVLESIDYPAEPLSVFFEKRYGIVARHRFPLQPVSAPPLPGEDMGDEAVSQDWASCAADLEQLLVSGKRTCPKTQAYGIARAALAADHSPEADGWERLEQFDTELLKGDEDKPLAPRSAFHRELRRFKLLQKQRTAGERTSLLPDLANTLWKGVLRPPPVLLRKTDDPQNGGEQDDSGGPALGVARWQWIHLVELWDYLAPVKSEAPEDEGGNGNG